MSNRTSTEQLQGPLWTPTVAVERLLRQTSLSTADQITLDRKQLEGLLFDVLRCRNEHLLKSSVSETGDDAPATFNTVVEMYQETKRENERLKALLEICERKASVQETKASQGPYTSEMLLLHLVVDMECIGTETIWLSRARNHLFRIGYLPVKMKGGEA